MIELTNISLYSNRGWSYNKKDYDKAVADYPQAVRLDPVNTEYRDNLERVRQL